MNIVAVDPSLISTALVVTSGDTFKIYNYCRVICSRKPYCPFCGKVIVNPFCRYIIKITVLIDRH